MYDWNALWNTHQGYRTGYVAPHEDINDLARELGASLIKPAKGHGDIAVYQADKQYTLVGHGDGLQILTLTPHAMFDINTRFVGQDEGQEIKPPYIEVLVSNPATREQEAWRGAIRRDGEGRVWLEKQLLSEGVMPAMEFDSLSFTDLARFRDMLYSSWQLAMPKLQAEIDNWVPDAEQNQVRQARYQALIKHESAILGRIFTAEERQLIQRVLTRQQLGDPASCRGLWLKMEAEPLEADLKIDIEALLEKMRKLSYAQELALVETL